MMGVAAHRKDHCGRCGRSKTGDPEAFRLTRRGVSKPYRMHHVCRPCELIAEAENRKIHADRKARGQTGACSVGECGKPVHAGGRCRPHYDHDRRQADTRQCDVEGCTLTPSAHGYCTTHLARLRKDGTPGTAERRRAPRGTGYVNAEGYRMIRVPGSSHPQKEHRVVMAATLGRPLRAGETVHHINGVRHDNRVQNLELWSSSHPSGQRVADKIEWAKEFLVAYLGPQELRVWVEGLDDDGIGAATG